MYSSFYSIIYDSIHRTLFQPFNAIATVRLMDVAKHAHSGRNAILKLHRSRCHPNRSALPTPPKQTPPSHPPGNLSLRLSLGAKIGEGASGLVYEAVDVSLSRSPKYSQSSLPPLVVKICRNFQPYKLPREAFIYEEMEKLHGLVVARYYGCFETIIPPGVTFPIWQNHEEYSGSDLTESDHPYIPRVLNIIVMERLGSQHLPLRKPVDEKLRYGLSCESV